MFEYAASFVCHQVPERTLTIGDRLLPLCARCTGIYSGFLIGIVFQILMGSRTNRLPPLAINALSAVIVLALIMEGLGQRLSLWELSNQARLALGLLCGSAISITVFPLFNYFLQRHPARSRSIPLQHYLGLLSVIGFFFAFHYVPSSSLIYAFISTAGMLAVYLVVNLTIAGIFLDWKRRMFTLRNSLTITGVVFALFLGETVILRIVH